VPAISKAIDNHEIKKAANKFNIPILILVCK